MMAASNDSMAFIHVIEALPTSCNQCYAHTAVCVLALAAPILLQSLQPDLPNRDRWLSWSPLCVQLAVHCCTCDGGNAKIRSLNIELFDENLDHCQISFENAGLYIRGARSRHEVHAISETNLSHAACINPYHVTRCPHVIHCSCYPSCQG